MKGRFICVLKNAEEIIKTPVGSIVTLKMDEGDAEGFITFSCAGSMSTRIEGFATFEGFKRRKFSINKIDGEKEKVYITFSDV